MDRYLKAALWVVIVLIVALAVGWVFFEVETVPDNSMAPTLWMGDRILLLKRGELKRGDIGVCEHPEFPGQVVMGRVIGVPGDTVEIARNQLRVNGEIIHEEAEGPFIYWDRESSTQAFELKFLKKKAMIGGSQAYMLYDEQPLMSPVPSQAITDGYYLVGDNRVHRAAIDSRTYGPVHESLCRGKGFFVFSATKGIGDADLTRRSFTFLVD